MKCLTDHLPSASPCCYAPAANIPLPHSRSQIIYRTVGQVVKDIACGAGGVWFDSWPAQIGHSVANAAMFLRSCVVPALSRKDGSRLSLRCNTIWFSVMTEIRLQSCGVLVSMLTTNNLLKETYRGGIENSQCFKTFIVNNNDNNNINCGYFQIILNWKINSNWGRLRSELALFESAATRKCKCFRVSNLVLSKCCQPTLHIKNELNRRLVKTGVCETRYPACKVASVSTSSSRSLKESSFSSSSRSLKICQSNLSSSSSSLKIASRVWVPARSSSLKICKLSSSSSLSSLKTARRVWVPARVHWKIC